jgi:hypothetical protein
MKSLLNILSLISLLILLPLGISGKSFSIRHFTTEQDTSSLSRKLVVDTFPLPIIPPSSGVQFFRDKILFLSLAKNEMKMSPDHISFGTAEAYYASVLDSVPGKHYLFSPFLRFSLPCEAVTFNPSFDTIYFTKLARNGKEKIHMAKYAMGNKPEAGLSGELITLDFCTGNYTYSHPSLSADGKVMIFASDREGTQGGMDLFITRRFQGIWSIPENLGKVINSAGNEFFPFLDPDNNLFYSSDGLKGNGGYDIFRCKFNGKSWGIPVNLPNGINSGKDEIAFTLNPVDKKTAFFTRKSGKDELQLFKITGKQENSNLLAVFNGTAEPKTLTAVVTDKEKSKPANVEPVNTVTEKQPEKTPEKPLVKPSAKIPEKEPEKKTATISTVTPNISTKPKPATGQTDSAVVTIKLTHPLTADQVDQIIYRVQILSSDKPRKEKEITLAGKKYSLFEYFYKGAYRYCIGEYTTPQAAVELRKLARETSYAQAFLVIFRNNKRALSQNSFR